MVVVRYLQARGASLVDRHKVDPSKAKKAAGGKEGGGKKTFSWSREEDFEQRKKFTPQVNEVVGGCAGFSGFYNTNCFLLPYLLVFAHSCAFGTESRMGTCNTHLKVLLSVSPLNMVQL